MAKVEKANVKDNIVLKPQVKQEEIYPQIKNFNKKKFNLNMFLSLAPDVQFDTVKNLLEQIYAGTLKIDKSHVLKCIAVTVDDGDTIAYLPYDLRIERTKKELVFSIDRESKLPFFVLFFLGAFLFLAIAASYTTINYVNLRKLNVDLNGDGVPDLNIDLDGDKKPDLNIDTNNDKKPDLNITYKGNRKNIFNVDTEGNRSASANLINIDANNDGVCDINCDIDGDGWPDLFIDVDGDKLADFEIDLDKDNIPDLNIDMDGDLVCDLMCDTDGDKKCDKYCVKPEYIKNPSGIDSSGNAESSTSTPELFIVFTDGNMVTVNDLYPTDQPGVEPMMPTKTFSIHNPNDAAIMYYVKWIVYDTVNQFTTDNFKYKIECDGGGFTTVNNNNPDGFLVAPKEPYDIISQPVTIYPLTTHNYTITMKLQGTGEPQDDDQGRTFAAKLYVFTDPLLKEPTN